LIPVSTGFFAMTGLVQLQETVEMVKQQLNPSLEIMGGILNNSITLCALLAYVDRYQALMFVMIQ
jgi:cellulose biosynthesis protein BcsQ